MTVVRGFGLNGRSFYTNIAKPMAVNMTFTVTPTNGLGITSLKSNGYVRNVFMHTSTTPTANDGYTNPNPASGYALIQLTNPFNRYIGMTSSLVSATTTSTKIDNSALTVGQAYVITTLGDASLAKWQSVGVPVGITPAVGVSFIATAVGTGSNVLTSRVQVPTSSGISAVEVVGDPNTMLAPSNIASNGGAFLVVQFLGEVATIASYTPAGTINTPTFTGESYTPAGTVSAPTFTGSALSSHSHDLLVKGGQAGSTTNDVAIYAGPKLGKEEAADATVLGGSASNGGVQTASGGTPAGTVSAPTFTGSAHTLAGTISALTFTGSAGSLTGTVSLGVAAPTTGCSVSLGFLFDGSSVTVDGL